MEHIQYLIETYLDNIDNQKQITMYYNIGLYIRTHKLNTKELELFLKDKYGIVIAFTERNLNNMVKFSNYNKTKLSKLVNITWKNILVIMKYSDDLIDICLEYKPTKYQLENYIKNNKQLQKNDIIELDDTLDELKKIRK